jgi:hypothetical protein
MAEITGTEVETKKVGTEKVETQNWTDVFLSSQKRARSALLLSALVSCLVLITVLNLALSREKGVPTLNTTAAAKVQEEHEEHKEHIRHFVDRSYYQLPLLGIQISCDDAAIFGPLALLVFSFYSWIAFRALHHQCECVEGHTSEHDLTRKLLQPEFLPWALERKGKGPHNYWLTPKALMRLLLFLPATAAVGLMIYELGSLFVPPYYDDQALWLTMNPVQRIIAVCFDIFGVLCTRYVIGYNRCTFRLCFQREAPQTSHQEAPQASGAPAGAGAT